MHKMPNRLVVLILFILWFEPTFAQQLHAFDSILKANTFYYKQDDKKVKLLNSVSIGYAGLNPLLGVEHAKKALDLAKIIKLPEQQAAALYNLALNQMALGLLDDATVHATYSKNIYDSLKIVHGSSATMLLLADVFLLKNDFVKVEDNLKSVIKLTSTHYNENALARAYKVYADLENVKDNYDEALQYNKQSIDLNKRNGSTSGLVQNNLVYGKIYSNTGEYNLAISYFEKALELNSKLGDKIAQATILGNLGNAYRYLGNYNKALEFYQKSLKIDEELNNIKGIANQLANIGSVYGILSEYDQAKQNYIKAYDLFEQMGNKKAMALCLANIGNCYDFLNDPEKSLTYFLKASKIYDEMKFALGKAETDVRIGNAYFTLKQFDKTLEYFNKAKPVAEQYKRGSNRLLASIYTNECLVFLEKKQFQNTILSANKAISIADSNGLNENKKSALKSLSIAYEMVGKYDSAYIAFKKYNELREMLLGDSTKNAITRKMIAFEFERKETELRFEKQLAEEKFMRSKQELSLKEQALIISNKQKDLQRLAYLKKQAELQAEKERAEQKEKEFVLKETIKQGEINNLKSLNQIALLTNQRRQGQLVIAGIALSSLLILSIAISVQNRKRKKLNMQLSIEKQKSDDLLLNILPAEVADELKTKGEAEARLFDNVSVLFTDFVGFTKISEAISPKELVKEIHYCFKAFDEITELHGLEKIKTIGDAYLAVAGLNNKDSNHVNSALSAAKAMVEFICNYKAKGGYFDIRIGIHSGPVIAGIVGSKKFAYDIWGDTVNTAARMEQNSETNKINISGDVFKLANKQNFAFSYRGKLPAKNKGDIDMYFLN